MYNIYHMLPYIICRAKLLKFQPVLINRAIYHLIPQNGTYCLYIDREFIAKCATFADLDAVLKPMFGKE